MNKQTGIVLLAMLLILSSPVIASSEKVTMAYWPGTNYNAYRPNYSNVDIIAFDAIDMLQNGSVDYDRFNPALYTKVQTNCSVAGTKILLDVHRSDPAKNTTYQDILVNNRTVAIESLTASMIDKNADGIALDFENVPEEYAEEMGTFIRDLRSELESADEDSMLVIAIGRWSEPVYDNTTIKDNIDYVAVMQYDYRSMGSATTGPTLSMYYLPSSIAYIDNYYPHNQTIQLLPNYGYRWNCSNSSPGAAITGTGEFIQGRIAESGSLSNGLSRAPTNMYSPWYANNTSGVWSQTWYEDDISLALKSEYILDNYPDMAGIGYFAMSFEKWEGNQYQNTRNIYNNASSTIAEGMYVKSFDSAPTQTTMNLGEPIITPTAININISYDSKYTDDPYEDRSEMSGKLARWTYDNLTGINASDSTGNSHTGTVSGATQTSGKYNNALSFDGVNDYVNVTNKNGLALNNGGTIAAWIYLNPSRSISGRVVDKTTTTTGANGYSLSISTQGIVSLLINGTTSSSGNILGDNQWYFVVATFNSSGRELYVNNVKRTISDSNLGSLPPNSTAPFRIGNRAGYTDRAFNGKIDDLIILDRYINSTERDILYYDNIVDLKVRADANDTYSEEWNYQSNNPLYIPTKSTDTIRTIYFDTPENTTIGEITIYNYSKTSCPVDISCISNSTLNYYYNYDSYGNTSYRFDLGYYPRNNYTRVVLCQDMLYPYVGIPTGQNLTVERDGTHLTITHDGAIHSNVLTEHILSVPIIHHSLYTGYAVQWNSTAQSWDFVGNIPENHDSYIGDQIEVTIA